MSWYNKEYASRFDTTPIMGLFFLDGRQVELHHSQQYVWCFKSPMIEFPSGEVHPLWDEHSPQVVVLTTVDVPLFATRDEAIGCVQKLADAGLIPVSCIEKIGDDQLFMAEPTGDACLLTYDNPRRTLVNVLTAGLA